MLTWCAWKAALQQVLGIPHLLNADGQMAGNSLINTKYIQGAACKIWVTEISSDSCWNDGCLAGNSLINGTYILGAAYGWMAGNTPINGTYIPGAAYGRMAGNSLIHGKYIQGAACEVWVTQISSDPFQTGVHAKLLLSGC
ncbi:hypothetical protein M404DRAFT_10281 [Pisolithus tinctorius Marx 270]|uniref:Uncharacterized protein n=1 Tax=Pisolithus tinctorius Marx 270 TaxID=870435 RepID=A0A0C3JQZ8_PISTI|nr:hypothetical protein M404DRAFT_10281 [Pisolithus tinctorius Marx 270]